MFFFLVELIQLRANGMLNIPFWLYVVFCVLGAVPCIGGPLGLFIMKLLGMFTGPAKWFLFSFIGGIPAVDIILFIVLKLMGIFTISWWYLALLIFGDILVGQRIMSEEMYR
jgi:hypothetical protein